MKTHRPFPSEHKLARLSRWAMLRLELELGIVFAAFSLFGDKLSRDVQHAMRRQVGQLRRFVACWLILRAAPRALAMRTARRKHGTRGLGARASWPACGATLRAAAREDARAPTHKHHRFHNTPRGFAWRRAGNRIRCAIGGRLHRALSGKTLLDQIAILWRVLANPERHVAQLAKRLARGFCSAHLAAIAPPALVLMIDASALAPASADTS